MTPLRHYTLWHFNPLP